MAELSFPWDGISLGDAAIAPYSAAEFSEFRRIGIDDNNVSPMQRAHVAINAFGEAALRVSGVATPVTVDAGYAMVAGSSYLLTGPTTIAVPTPAANPRLDRIILRIDYAAQTIRVVRLAGTEAAVPTPPALTQTIGTTYEVSLAQVYVTTGGVITVRDERLGAFGLSQSVLYRDLAGRTLEEFFDNFSGGSISGWTATVVTSGANSMNTSVPTSTNITSGATANSSLTLNRGLSTQYPTELAQAPLLFEARVNFVTGGDADTSVLMRLINSAGTQNIIFGIAGALSVANLAMAAVNGGTTSFVTHVAIDVGAVYHTLGIYVPGTTGPAIAFYDGVAIGQVAATLPTSTTDLRAEFFVGNGATAAARTLNIDWARLVRGTP